MATRLSTGLRNTALDAGLGPAYDGGTGRINLYAGAQPASANDAHGGTLLGTLTLAADAFGAATSGVITAAAATGDSSADAAGAPPYSARLYRTGDTAPNLAAAATDRRLDVAVGGRTAINDADGITAADTTITVDDTSAFPAADTILIDAEQITYTGKTATTFTGCTRGVNGTTAATHADNAQVTQVGVELTIDSAPVLGGAINLSSLTLTQPAG